MKGSLSLRGFRKLRTGAIVATGVFLIGLANVQTTVQASEEDGVWVARTVEQVKADIQKEDNFFKYEIKWGDTLSVISEATNIPVDVLKEMNRISDRNLFLPHNELLYTEGESVTDSKTKHKIVIKESYGKKEVRTYEVVLQKNQETTEVSFELKETTEKVQESNRSVVSYDEVYNLVSEVAPAQPAEDQPVAPGGTETPAPAQPTEEQPTAPGATETPVPTKPVEEQPTAPGATETPVPTKPVEEQPTAPGTTEKPATAQPTEEQPATPGATEIPAPAQPEVPSNKVEGTEEPENKAETAPADPETTVEGATSGQPSEESGTTASATQPNSTEDTAGDSNTSNNPVVVEKEEPGKADSSSKPAEGTSETTGTAADSINNAEGTAPTQPEGGTSVTPEVNDGATGRKEETQGNPEAPSNKVEGTEETGNKAETAPANPETTVEGATSGQPSEESGTTANATQPNSTEDTAGDSNTSNDSVVVEKEESEKADSSSTPAEGTSETTGTAADSTNKAEGTAGATTPTQPEGATSVTPEVNDGATGGEEETQGNPEAPSNKVEGTEETGNKAETAPANPETTVEGATSGQPSEESGTTANATQPNSTEDTAGDSNTSNDSVVVEKEESEKADSSSTPAEGTSETTGTAADSTNKAEGTAGATTPTQPEGEISVDKKDSVKKAKNDSIEENIMTVYNRKLELINKLSDEKEKNELKMGLEALKNEAVAAINEANNEEKVISVTEYYQNEIDGFEVPGEEFNGPDFSKEGLSNGRNDGTTIDENSSGNIGHASSSPTSNTSNEDSNNRENTAFRNAPVYQPRVTRRARSVDEPMDKVAIYYNYTEMKDIAGFLGDPGETVVTVPKGATHEQVQAIVKSKIDEKKAELAKKGYTFLEDYFVDKPQEDTIRYDYIVNFTKPSSLRMAPKIQPRASRTRRAIEEPKVKTRTITLYYQLAELEIAGSLGNPGQNYVITVPETATAEEIQQAIDQQTSREKASLSRYFQYVGETNLQNDILDRGFGNFDYVITFARRK